MSVLPYDCPICAERSDIVLSSGPGTEHPDAQLHRIVCQTCGLAGGRHHQVEGGISSWNALVTSIIATAHCEIIAAKG